MIDLQTIGIILSYLLKVGFIPILLFSDYFLTVYTKRISQQAYSRIFQHEELELNPNMREAINKLKVFNPKHILITVILTTFSLCLTILALFINDSSFYMILDIFLGCIFGMWAMMNARHLTNIMIVRKINKTPGLVTGNVKLTLEYNYYNSKIQTFGVLIIIAILTLFSFSYFLLGACLGLVSLILTHNKMSARSKQQILNHAETEQ